MNVKFSSGDRHAVDLVLDHPAAGSSNGGGHEFTQAADGKLRQRVERVEKVLGLLDEMPANEPSAGLVNRTLRRVEREGVRRPVPSPQVQAPPPSPPRPVADRPVH